jgi:hypothetical protein
MLGVEAHSFLPDEQRDCGHLARQSQPRHFRPDSLGHQRIVKFFKRASLRSGHGGGTLEWMLQFVIVIAIQPTNRGRFLRPLQLSLDKTLFGTAVRLDPKSAVGLELALGAKAMRCLDQSDQQSRPDRADERNLAQQFPGVVLLRFREQCAPHFLAQCPQRIELLVVELRPAAHAGFLDLAQPLCSIAFCVNLFSSAGNSPTAVDRLHASHHPYEICADRQIFACGLSW